MENDSAMTKFLLIIKDIFQGKYTNVLNSLMKDRNIIKTPPWSSDIEILQRKDLVYRMILETNWPKEKIEYIDKLNPDFEEEIENITDIINETKGILSALLFFLEIVIIKEEQDTITEELLEKYKKYFEEHFPA